MNVLAAPRISSVMALLTELMPEVISPTPMASLAPSTVALMSATPMASLASCTVLFSSLMPRSSVTPVMVALISSMPSVEEISSLTSLTWLMTPSRPSSARAFSAAWRKERTPRPSWRPISGRRLGPKTSRAMKRTTMISAGPMLMRGTVLKGGWLHSSVGGPMQRFQRGPPRAAPAPTTARRAARTTSRNACKRYPLSSPEGAQKAGCARTQPSAYIRPTSAGNPVAAPGPGGDSRDERISHKLAVLWLFVVAGAALVVLILLFSKLINPQPPHAREACALRVRHRAGGRPVAPVRRALLRLRPALPRVRRGVGVPVPRGRCVFRTLGTAGFVEMMLFIAVLGVGLLYAWRKGALEWA